MKGIELSRQYYETYGKPMLENTFPDIFNLLCVGLVGSGSECFGFDDEISTDHDFEPSFCIFYPEDLLSEKEVFNLERAYAKLPDEFSGFKRQKVNPVGGARRGVISIGDFYKSKIGKSEALSSYCEWLSVPDFYLAEATNGEIFSDNFGRFTNIRNSLINQPFDVRLKKLAGHVICAAQAGQYNYSRCISHGEKGASYFALCEFSKHIIASLYLLENKYMPYYKWAFGGLREFTDIGEKIEKTLDEKNEKIISEKIEDISARLTEIIVLKGLAPKKSNNLEEYAYLINDKIKDNNLRNENIFIGII